MHRNAFQDLFAAVEKMLKEGIVPWRRPWTFGRSKNLITERPYNFLNHVLLISRGFVSPYWLTERQLHTLGGRLKKNARPSYIYVWWYWEISPDNPNRPRPRFGSREEPRRRETGLGMKRIQVYNTEQCHGIAQCVPEYRILDFVPVDKAEHLVRCMPQRPEILEGKSNVAGYSLTRDTVLVPRREVFQTVEEYYSTLFHELVHSTGHPSRLNRKNLGTGFGTREYALEELVAEMGAHALCTECALSAPTRKNSASYIVNWLEVLQRDKGMLLRAAAAAEKAVRFILETSTSQSARPGASSRGRRDTSPWLEACCA
ncbi:MAG: zincin-like metallopeptidase domain-containing protein [Desulfosoma sp.]